MENSENPSHATSNKKQIKFIIWQGLSNSHVIDLILKPITTTLLDMDSSGDEK